MLPGNVCSSCRVVVGGQMASPDRLGIELDAVGALVMVAVGAIIADDQHGTALAAAGLVGGHFGWDGCF